MQWRLSGDGWYWIWVGICNLLGAPFVILPRLLTSLNSLPSPQSISVPPTRFVNVPYNMSILKRPPRMLVPATATAITPPLASEQTQDILISDSHQHQPQPVPETNTIAHTDLLAYPYPVPPHTHAKDRSSKNTPSSCESFSVFFP
jgi:hypothetical protein